MEIVIDHTFKNDRASIFIGQEAGGFFCAVRTMRDMPEKYTPIGLLSGDSDSIKYTPFGSTTATPSPRWMLKLWDALETTVYTKDVMSFGESNLRDMREDPSPQREQISQWWLEDLNDAERQTVSPAVLEALIGSAEQGVTPFYAVLKDEEFPLPLYENGVYVGTLNTLGESVLDHVSWDAVLARLASIS